MFGSTVSPPGVLPSAVTWQVSPSGPSDEEPGVTAGRGQGQDTATDPGCCPGDGDRDSHPWGPAGHRSEG